MSCGCQGRLGGSPDSFKVAVLEKGGVAGIMSTLPDVTGTATARLNDTSTATFTLARECCEQITQLETWFQEAAVTWDGHPFMAGPLVHIDYSYEGAKVDAKGLSQWFRKRIHGEQTHQDVDVATIWDAYRTDGLAALDDLNIEFIGASTGILSSREIAADELPYVWDSLGEVTEAGLDWTERGRTMIYGGRLSDQLFTGIVLRDHDFADPPGSTEDGVDYVTRVRVVGRADTETGELIQGLAFDSTAESRLGGQLVLVHRDDEITSKAAADALAAAKLQDEQRRFFVNLGQSMVLSRDAPVCIHQLIPGVLVRLRLEQLCRPVDQLFQISAVQIRSTGDVAVSLTPAFDEVLI